MAGELGLEKFRAEFEKLYETLKVVHENERRLTKKCNQLNDEIADNVARVSAVLGMTQDELEVNAGIRQVQLQFHVSLDKIYEVGDVPVASHSPQCCQIRLFIPLLNFGS